MTSSLLQLCTVLFTVAMLCISVYFLVGSVPLLILKHDTPVDGNFIRSFFNLYYRVAAFVATAATLTYALSGRPWSIATCLKTWGKHPFGKKPTYKTLSTSVKVFGIGKDTPDTEATSSPALVLINLGGECDGWFHHQSALQSALGFCLRRWLWYDSDGQQRRPKRRDGDGFDAG